MYEIADKVDFKNIKEEQILVLWENGFDLQQVIKNYMKSEKRKGNKLTKLQAQQYVEPIIFRHQLKKMKGE